MIFKRENGEAKGMKGREGEQRERDGRVGARITHLPFFSAKQRTWQLISWAHLDQGKFPYLTFYDIAPSGNCYVEAH